MRVLAALLILGGIVLLLAGLMPARPSLSSPMTIDPLRVSTGLI